MARFVRQVLLMALMVASTEAWFFRIPLSCKKDTHCSWRSWGSWCGCRPSSGTCGRGTEYRVRTLYRNSKFCVGFGFKCTDIQKDTRSCTKCCPRDCRYGGWSSWSSCNFGSGKTCGTGSQFRSRSYVQTAYCGGKSCSGPIKETRTCQKCCPRDCLYGSWSSWSPCNFGSGKTCGSGSQFRTRKCTQTAYCGGKPCSGPTQETRSCSECCPVDCLWGDWGKWSDCSQSCGGGTENRSRSISRQALCGGRVCTGSGTESRSCNAHCCVENCEWNNWCQWSGCTKSCGGGEQARTRDVSKQATCGGTCNEDPIIKRSCNNQVCPSICTSKTICEDHKETISCGTKEIHVVSALYGRSDRTTCPDPRIKTTSCSATKSLELVAKSCDGKATCTLYASNSVFGDPCLNTYKYLKVGYCCR